MRIDIKKYHPASDGTQRADTLDRDKEPTTSWLMGSINAGSMFSNFSGSVYEGIQRNSCLVELFVCVPEELRQMVAAWDGG